MGMKIRFTDSCADISWRSTRTTLMSKADTHMLDALSWALDLLHRTQDAEGEILLTEQEVSFASRAMVERLGRIMDANPPTSEAYKQLLPLAKLLTIFLT